MESSTTTATTLLLLLHHYPPPPPPPPPPWRFRLSLLSLSSQHSPLRFRPLRPVRAQKFDFEPPSYEDDDDEEFGGNGRNRSRRRRPRRPKRRQWWFDEREQSDQLGEREPSILDQVVDSLWFLKVLRPYGWSLPAILLSLLLATGPKAFLMAFSLPLGFSVLALTFKKLTTWLEGTPEPNPRRRTKSPFAQAKPSSMDEEDDSAYGEESQTRRRSQKSRYRSSVAGNNGPVYTGNSSSKFGGWDELIIEEEKIDPASTPDQKIDEQGTPMQEEPASMPVRERELPLLLKLLVALFPFLGSWTSLL